MALPHELPLPDAVALHHSARLVHHIRSAIHAANGTIPFVQFMEMALYAPGLGYYSAGSHKFGATGDFVTAPELSPLFGQCLARQCQAVLAQLGGAEILEFGAGSGALAVAVMRQLNDDGFLPERYLIMEVSGDMRQRQQEYIAQVLPHFMERFVWLDTLPTTFRGVVLANEVLDAMPIHRFRIAGERVLEAHVGWSSDRLVENWHPINEGALVNAIRRAIATSSLPDNYTSEINLAAARWVASVAEMLEAGLVLVIDYGFPRAEFYHPERNNGTLMCHYRHRAHDNPLLMPGLQDITSHIDFTLIGEEALANDLHVMGFASQANFLLATGLLEIASITEDDLRRQMEMAAQVKRLILPGEMGELFKVMALGRNIDGPLQGFMLRDERHRL